MRLDARRAPAMLDDIVQRSELLLRVDENDGLYEFPHLTIQEYLAALELAHDPERLINLYQEDRIRWREVVKLWCGTARRDCSSVVRAVFSGDEDDRLLALECLAEAGDIDETLARTIIGRFEEIGLDVNGTTHQALTLNALGAVAASQSTWGREAFEHLARAAEAGGPTSSSAMQALAASRRPEAMTILTRLADDPATARLSRAALRTTGEQAIQVFRDRAQVGKLDAIDDLASIATASAGLKLAELLTQPTSEVATRAAWHLARLIMDPDIEEALSRSWSDVPDQGILTWLWEPFGTAGRSNFARLMGRVAFLLWHSKATQIPDELDIIDPRLGIPVSMIRAASEASWDKPLTSKNDEDLSHLWSTLEVIQQGSPDRRPTELANILSDVRPSLYESVLRETGAPGTVQRLLSLLPWRLRVFGLVALLKTGEPVMLLTESSWRRLRHGPPKLGWLAVAAGIAALVLLPIIVTGGIRAMLSSLGLWSWGPLWLSWVITPCFLAWAAFSFSSRWLPRSQVARRGLALVSRLSLLGTAWFVAATLALLVGWPLSATLVGTTLVVAFGLDYLYQRRLRASRNPLRAMLELYRHELRGADPAGSGSAFATEPPALSHA
jgi:hypothetical protein